jgi:hypothetical protein
MGTQLYHLLASASQYSNSFVWKYSLTRFVSESMSEYGRSELYRQVTMRIRVLETGHDAFADR